MDVVLTFFTATLDGMGRLVVGRKEIAMQYMRGFFLVDLISAIPFELLGVLFLGTFGLATDQTTGRYWRIHLGGLFLFVCCRMKL